MRKASNAAKPAPSGLVAERFQVDGVEFVAFSWQTTQELSGLTAAEREVASLLVAGATNAEIARERGAALRTVANQVASILRKAGVSSRYELVARFGGATP